MNRRLLIGIITVLLICLGLVVASIEWVVLQSVRGAGPLASGSPNPSPSAAIASGVTPPPPETPLASVPKTTADELQQTNIPERDLYQIVPRLRKEPSLATPAPTPAARTRKLGDKDTLYVVQDASTGTYRSVTATLQAITPHSYFWVEDGLQFDQAALQKSAQFFENNIYPTDHKFFGNERSPGPDGDVHIHVLTTRFRDAAGYFSSEDTYPRALVPYSNQRNIIYMNIDVTPGSDEYLGDMAHEFQHLIHSYEAEHEAGWIDEGMSELAIKENGFDVGSVLRIFAQNPNTQLDTWANDPQASAAHYAASYLFFDYTAGRFGPDFTRAVIHAPREGIFGLQAVLDQSQRGLSLQDLFSDWAVANYLNDPKVANGKYAYTNEPFHISNQPTLGQFPLSRTATMHEYASNYYTLQPSGGDVTLNFTGTTTVKVIPADAHSGHWMWYSNRADLSDMTLTRQVDLSNASKATLQFWTWYDIETDFDYAYVETSTDGGKTWDILPGKYTTTSNPNGASYGPAFTGRSGVQDPKSNAPAQWVQEQIDLSAYAGKKIALRFEYITDDAYNAPSWAIDDMSIPEIDLSDNIEGGSGDWQAQGFVRTDNVLPQQFVVQVVQVGNTTQVVRVPLDGQNRGTITISGFGKDVSRAALVITAFAPTTTESTEYQFSIAPK